LLKNGAEVDWKDNNGWTPLRWAVEESGIDDNQSESSLQPVVWEYDMIIQKLIENGAQVDSEGDDGETPLPRVTRLGATLPEKRTEADIGAQHIVYDGTLDPFTCEPVWSDGVDTSRCAYHDDEDDKGVDAAVHAEVDDKVDGKVDDNEGDDSGDDDEEKEGFDNINDSDEKHYISSGED
jgi:hypothetical protein